MHIVLGADHGGWELKNELRDRLAAEGHRVEDLGTNGPESVDYPDVAKLVAGRVAADHADRGILVCGTGQGMNMAANKVQGVRAAVVSDTFSARMASEHNDARVLCIGARVVGSELAWACVDAWLGAEFGGGRHQRRVDKIAG